MSSFEERQRKRKRINSRAWRARNKAKRELAKNSIGIDLLLAAGNDSKRQGPTVPAASTAVSGGAPAPLAEATPSFAVAKREAKVAMLMRDYPAALVALDNCEKSHKLAMGKAEKALKRQENALINSAAELARLQAKSLPPPPISPIVCAAMQVRHGISETSMDSLRRLVPKGVLPSRQSVRTAIDKATPRTKLHDFPELNVQLVVADMGSILRLNLQSQQLKIPAGKRFHCIVIGGDGLYHRPKARLGKRDALLQGCLRWLDNGNDSNGMSILVAGFAVENKENVYATAAVMHQQIRMVEAESKEGFNVFVNGEWQQHAFYFILSADMKWQRMAMGMVGGMCSHPCPYCTIARSKMKEKGHTARLIAECDQPIAINAPFSNYGDVAVDRSDEITPILMRTPLRIAKWCENRLENTSATATTTAACGGAAAPPPLLLESKRQRKRKPIYSHDRPSAIGMDPGDIAPEPLHMLLRLFCGRLDHIFATLWDKLQPGEYNGTISANLHANVKKIYLEMGIHAGITGLTGVECKKLLEKRSEWAAHIAESPYHSHFLHALNELHALFAPANQSPHQSALEWRSAAQKFAIFVSQWFNDWYGGCVYLHILACHAWRWWPINRFSTCGLEKLNFDMKMAKNNVWQCSDAKAGEQMVEIVNKLNRRASLAMESPPRHRAVYSPSTAAAPPPSAASPPSATPCQPSQPLRRRFVSLPPRRQRRAAAAAAAAATATATAAPAQAKAVPPTPAPAQLPKASPPAAAAVGRAPPAPAPPPLPAPIPSPKQLPKRLRTPTAKMVNSMSQATYDRHLLDQ